MAKVVPSLRCRGMRDMLPREMARFRHVEQVLRTVCAAFGYSEVRTPTVEYLHLFTAAGTLSPHMLGRVYSFHDWDGWSGARVVLRPDATIPVVRLYTEQRQPGEIAKLFYVENVFRFTDGEEPRESWQWGLEVIGDTAPVGDIELVLLACQVLEQLGLTNTDIYLSHAGLVRAVLAKAGLTPDEQVHLYDRVLDGDLDVLTGLEGRLPRLRTPIRLLFELEGTTPDFLHNLGELFAPAVPEISQPLSELMPVAETLYNLGCRMHLCAALARNFEYYTGPVFQFRSNGARIGSGGRYDELVRLLSGHAVAATGLALDLDALIGLIGDSEIFPSSKTVLIQVATATAALLTAAFEAARRLTAAGWRPLLSPAPPETGRPRWEMLIDQRESGPAYVLHDRENDSWTVHQELPGALAALMGVRP